MLKYFYFQVIFFVLSALLYAQSYKIEKLTISSGLSQNSAKALMQDNKGFIWIGTKDGLDRFDGVNFKVYRHSNKKNSLISNSIRSLYQDAEGNIWIGTNDGLSKFIPKTERFISYQNNDSKNSGSNVITSILEDSSKNIWVGSLNGLVKLNTAIAESPGKNNTAIKLQRKLKQLKIFNKKAISCLYEDRAKNIWVGTYSNGLYYIPKEGKTVQSLPIDSLHQKGGKINHITSICELSDKGILVGTAGEGTFIFNIKKRKFIKYTPGTNGNSADYKNVSTIKRYKDSYFILTNRRLYFINRNRDTTIWKNNIVPAPTTFFIDKGGIIWIGSDGGGIVKLVPYLKKFYSVTTKNNLQYGFAFSSIRAILKTDNNLFIGGYTGLMEARNFKPGIHNTWMVIKAFRNVNVYSIYPDPINHNILWVGSEGSWLYKYNLKTNVCYKFSDRAEHTKYYFPFNAIYDIISARNHDMYFAANNGIAKYSLSSKKFTSFIYNRNNPNSINKGKVLALCEDSTGNIWIGTDRSGISIYNPHKNSFTRIISPNNANDTCSLSSNRVNIIFRDSKNNIWIGTAGGLDKYSYKKNNFIVYKTRNGLPNDYIYGILEDKTGCLWLSTNYGISKFNPKKNSFTNYDASYGLQSNEFNTAAYYKDKDGEMFFGGIKGLTYFYPNEINQNKYAPQVIITNFKKFNHPVHSGISISYKHKIILPYNDYFFSFDFIMPAYSNPSRHQFTYKLSGLDERWIDLNSGERTASFTAVPPGKYTLVVKGTNNDGIWSTKLTRLQIIIKPAYWDTWWFGLLSVFLICIIFFALYTLRVNRLKKEKEIQRDLTKKLIKSQEDERRNISTELHDDLGQNLLVVKNKLMLARRDNDFDENADGILEILDNTVKDVSNISHLLHPSDLEELGLSQAIESMVYRIKSASDIKIINRLLPLDLYFTSEEMINVFRIFQEALNNIMKHSHATKVILSSGIKGKSLYISISDNGKGFYSSNQSAKSNRPHLGLKGMNERALLLRGKLRIISVPDRGTEVKVEFKKRIKA